jgi:hypothetical protein
VSSAVESGVSLLLGAGEGAARFWKGAEPAARVRGDESAVWVSFCVVALSAPVPGVWAKSGWPGEDAVAPLLVVCGVEVPACPASCGPDALGELPRLGTVGAGAAAVGAEVGVGAYALATPAGAPATLGFDMGVGVDVVVGETSGPAEDAVASEA